MYGIIYCATNSVNGKRYVGQTTLPLGTRWRGHLKAAREGSRCVLHRAIGKYGISVFKIEQIDAAKSLEELNEKEAQHILRLSAMVPHGYNLMDGGKGHRVSSETSQKMSDAALHRKPISEETRQRISAASLGRKHSEKTRQKISTSQVSPCCKEGHQFTQASTYINPTSGSRTCLICFYNHKGLKLPEKIQQAMETVCAF